MLIFGDEGSGKTTLVETIGAQLIEHNSVVKYFQIEHCITNLCSQNTFINSKDSIEKENS